METRTCRETWELMTKATMEGPVRNFTCRIDMSDFLVETDLFPRDALDAYSAWNLEKEIREDQKIYFSEQRGGGQGDYREGMERKIANVVDCLSRFPRSKRALVTVCNNPFPDHESDGDAKCMREIHFHIDGSRLNATVLFRAQAAQIFPKNIHFIGSLMSEVGSRLPGAPRPGLLFYLATILVSDRS